MSWNNNPYLIYHIWKDAKKEAKNIPPLTNEDRKLGNFFAILICIPIAIIFITQGSLGVLFGLAVLIGLIQGISNNK